MSPTPPPGSDVEMAPPESYPDDAAPIASESSLSPRDTTAMPLTPSMPNDGLRDVSPSRHHHSGSAPPNYGGAPGSPQPLHASSSNGGYYGGSPPEVKRNSVVIKVGMVGDAQIGKTSLMVKYVEGSFDEDYIQTLGRWLSSGEAGRGRMRVSVVGGEGGR